MTKSTLKKYSILGLVLIAASAVTAAIIPAKEKKFANGQINPDSNGAATGADPTCTDAAGGNACFDTATGPLGSKTTLDGATTSLTDGASNTTDNDPES